MYEGACGCIAKLAAASVAAATLVWMPAELPHAVSRGGQQLEWVFLDRDGTLNASPPRGQYIEHPDELELLPGAAAAVRALNRAGLWTALVTNQRGVALGRMSREDLDAVHARLRDLLAL